jgi:hypothetical protein
MMRVFKKISQHLYRIMIAINWNDNAFFYTSVRIAVDVVFAEAKSIASFFTIFSHSKK